jgi:hypothetical protein
MKNKELRLSNNQNLFTKTNKNKKERKLVVKSQIQNSGMVFVVGE